MVIFYNQKVRAHENGRFVSLEADCPDMIILHVCTQRASIRPGEYHCDIASICSLMSIKFQLKYSRTSEHSTVSNG